MSVEIMENGDQDKQEMSHAAMRQYCKVSNRGGLCDNNLPSNDHHHHHQNSRIKPDGNKHSYFLRAKAPRFMGFRVTDEDGEFKKPSSSSSSFCKLGSGKERIMSPLILSSPIPSHHHHHHHHHHGSKSKQNFDKLPDSSEEEEDLANCLVMLSNKSYAMSSDQKDENKRGKEEVEKGMFQCKACKKVFNSHQALGGHRASHKKVKGCFASKLDALNEEDSIDEDSIQEDQEPLPSPESDATRPPATTSSTRKRAKMHECSVCRRVFSSGQALGGHKRCHWLTTSTDNAFIPNFQDFQYDHQSQQLCKKPMFAKPLHDYDHGHDHQLDLNLNLPPAPQHDQNHRHDGKTTTRYEASTGLCLKQWANHNQQKFQSDVINNNGDQEGSSSSCGMKLRKLSDLRDVNLDGGWLQMGIASTTEMR